MPFAQTIRYRHRNKRSNTDVSIATTTTKTFRLISLTGEWTLQGQANEQVKIPKSLVKKTRKALLLSTSYY